MVMEDVLVDLKGKGKNVGRGKGREGEMEEKHVRENKGQKKQIRQNKMNSCIKGKRGKDQDLRTKNSKEI